MNVVILASKEDFSNAIYNKICQKHNVKRVILEESVPTKTFLQRRFKKLGIKKVIGQILFIVFIQKPLKMFSKKRTFELVKQYCLDFTPIPENCIDNVNSVNDEIVTETLRVLYPDIVLVFGTRIIKEKNLNAVGCPFINMHMGITPLYRGVHGGYWALSQNDREHCGVTVHFVDKGIDTGSVINQEVICVTRNDNFITYPYLQFGEGLKLFVSALEEFENGTIDTKKVSLPSRLWSHPTIGEDLVNRFKYGIK